MSAIIPEELRAPREVVGIERSAWVDSSYVARLACGHSREIPRDVAMGSDALPDRLGCPSCPPKSPGADPGGSTPADSAEGVATPEDEADMALFGPLFSARSDLGAVDRELDKVGVGDGFKTIMAASRAQDKVQTAAGLIDEAWIILGGEIPDPDEGPTNGGTEGGALDVTGWPLTDAGHFVGRLTAALLGFHAGAGRYPARVVARADQRDVLGPDPDGGERDHICGVPLEVAG